MSSFSEAFSQSNFFCVTQVKKAVNQQFSAYHTNSFTWHYRTTDRSILYTHICLHIYSYSMKFVAIELGISKQKFSLILQYNKTLRLRKRCRYGVEKLSWAGRVYVGGVNWNPEVGVAGQWFAVVRLQLFKARWRLRRGLVPLLSSIRYVDSF